MQAGTYISGVGHLLVMGWAVLGGSFQPDTKPPEIQISDVSLVSEAAFAALVSDAPQVSPDIQTPRLLPDPADTPADPPVTPSQDTAPSTADAPQPQSPADADRNPDLADLSTVPETSALVDAPPGLTPPDAEAGVTLITPTAPISSRDSAGTTEPDQLAIALPSEQAAPRVDTKAAPEPDTDAEKADEVENATKPDQAGDEATQDTTEKAPDQASTEIITEAKEQPTSSAPTRSSRPKGRPERTSPTTPTQTPDPVDTASEIEKALAQAQAEAAQATPSGPPLTRGEKEGLRLAVQKCWNVGSLSSEALKVTVVVAVALEPNGKPKGGSIRMISSSDGSNVAAKQAYEAARRAIIRCGAKGFDLPKQKYDHWRDVEMTFNPEKMRIK